MDTNIVFMGSPEFALPILEELHKSFPITGVVTQPDRPSGRGRKMQAPAIKTLANQLDIPVIQPESLRDKAAILALCDFKPDLIVVAAYGQILKPAILDLPKFGCVNVHASLLPRWRGAAPIQAAILAGDARTGVTIMRMGPGLDDGPIITQRDVPLRPGTTGGELSDQLSYLGAMTLIEVLPSYLKGLLAPMPQDDSLATYAPRLQKSDGIIDLTWPAEKIVRQVLAYNPWPGTFYEVAGMRFKVHGAHAHDTFQSEVGAHYIVNGLPALGTAEGLLVLELVQPEGKKVMSGDAYLNGLVNWL